MPRRIVEIVSCSFCKRDLADWESSFEAVLTFKRSRYTYDICDSCAEPGGPFGDLVEAGIKERSSTKAATVAIEPEVEAAAPAPRKSSKQYRTKAELAALQRELAASGEGYECTMPGCGHLSVNPQGRGAHMRSVHVIVGTSKAS